MNELDVEAALEETGVLDAERFDPLAFIDRDPDISTAWWLLKALERVRKNLAIAEDAVHAFLSDVVPGGGLTVPDGPHVVIHNSASRTGWQHDELKAAVRRKIIEDLEGDIDAVDVALATLWDVCSPSWKVGKEGDGDVLAAGLRGMGVDPDEYCKTTWRKRAGLPR